jgi:hypothetical protein
MKSLDDYQNGDTGYYENRRAVGLWLPKTIQLDIITPWQDNIEVSRAPFSKNVVCLTDGIRTPAIMTATGTLDECTDWITNKWILQVYFLGGGSIPLELTQRYAWLGQISDTYPSEFLIFNSEWLRIKPVSIIWSRDGNMPKLELNFIPLDDYWLH